MNKLLRNFLWLIPGVLTLLGSKKSMGQISIQPSTTTYTQEFNLLPSTGTSNTWTNNSTLSGWFLFRQPAPGAPITTFSTSTGSATAGSFYSFGATGNSDRALGGLGSGGTYFGSPATGAVAGWIAFAATNNTGSTLTGFTVSFNGEQWRNNGNTTAQTMVLEYGFGASFDAVTNWIAPGGNFDWLSPVASSTATIVDGNGAGLVSGLGGTISSLSWPNGSTLWIRWVERNDPGNDHGLALDDFSFTANGSVNSTPLLSINDVSLIEGNSETQDFDFTVSLSSPAPVGGVTFDIATADNTAVSPDDYESRSLTNQTIPEGSSSFTFTVKVNGDLTPEGNETFFVNVTNVSGANISDGQGQGTIQNDDVALVPIHDIQGTGPTSPLANTTVTIEGVVTRTFAGATKLNGFYVQEEDADSDNDPATSEGIFVFDPAGAFTGTDGDKVRLTGTVAEFTSSSAGVASSLTQLRNLTSVINLGSTVLPTAVEVKLPVANVSDLERYEGMIVAMSATEGNLTVTDNFTLGRFGQVVLSATGASNAPGTDARLDQYTQFNLPSVSGYAAYLAEVAKRKIILDDGSGSQNVDPTLFGRGGQPLSATNTLRAGDEITTITAVLDERFEGYRLQTTTGVNFLPANERPQTVPSVGDATLKVAGFNLLNYFNGNGTGGGFPTSRGADNQVEFNRQRAKTIQAIVKSEADIFAFNELENDGYGPTSAIQDIVNGANDVLGAGTFTFIDPGTSTGTDEITVAMIYKPGKVTPVGVAKVIPDNFGNNAFGEVGRKPLAQTFEENATKARFTVVGNHWKSKGGSNPNGAGNVDAGDGQGQFNGTRTRQAQDLISWLATDPTGSNDTDYLILGDLNSYALENPVTTLEAGGYPNLISNSTYSYAFGGFFGSLDHALGSTSMQTQVTGATKWHINADEPIILDYNTEFKSAGQVASLFAPDQFRTSDHDPVIVGLSLVGPLVVEASAAPATICSNGTSELTASITGGKAPFTYTWTGPGTITTPGAATPQVSGLSAGPQVFTLDVTDSFNQTASTTVTVNVKAQPDAPALANASAVQGTADVVLSAANCAGTLIWTGTASGSGSSISVPTATPGTFTYSVQCQVGDCISEPASVSVTIIPLLTASVSASPDAILTNQTTNLTATIEGGTAPYTYEWTGPGIITNADQATATVAGLTPGEQVFTVKVTDATSPTAQLVTKTVSVFVTQANREPIAATIPNQTATAGTTFSLDITTAFSDPDNDALTYTATGLPAGLTLTNGVISGMPTTVEVKTVTVTATDPGTLFASTSFTFTVVQGPLKMLAPTYNCEAGQLTINVVAGNGNPIEYQISSVSKGWESKTTYPIEAKHIGKELKIRARQRASNGKGWDEVEVSFTPTACSANSRIGLPEAERVAELTLTVLGNPVADVVKVEIRGAEGQAVQLRLLDLQGRIIEARSIQAASEVEEHTFDVQRQASGILLLQATTPNQQKVAKVLKR